MGARVREHQQTNARKKTAKKGAAKKGAVRGKESHPGDYLLKPIEVPFDNLYLDCNNPRLAIDNAPGYAKVSALFNPTTQTALFQRIYSEHNVNALVEAIQAHGWMDIDMIVVWSHPEEPNKKVVVEGNRRLTALRRLRENVHPREKKKLDSMMEKGRTLHSDLLEQQNIVLRIEHIIERTKLLTVVPINAATVKELEEKLPRVLAVRHISGTKEWGNYAADLWLHKRYAHLFKDKFGAEAPLRWDPDLIKVVAEDASLSIIKARRRLQACALFGHFKDEWEDKLPKGGEFRPTDYFLFENIVKSRFLRKEFDVDLNETMRIPNDRAEALFKWTFKQPRGHTADDNENVFYRHENVLLWEQMSRYDNDNKTDFASYFDTSNPDSAPPMWNVEAKYKDHKSQRAPTTLLEELVAQLKALKADLLREQAAFLEPLLRDARDRADDYLKMIASTRKK
ncbi:MAG: hypothetical protein HC927_00145 [Deltaproteobacteria bacterium]|nr:hypothetical protein [Deltaproteobacteria bacterium]